MARIHTLPRVRSTRAQTPVLQLIDALFGLWRQRNALSQLDDQMLDDIGVTRDEADREAARPVWDVPRNWRQ